MAQGFDFNYDVTDELAAHYNSLREQRGWSWEVLADNLERQAAADPATPALVAWARGQGKGDAKAHRAAKKAAPEKR